jgi:hypothetical protein
MNLLSKYNDKSNFIMNFNLLLLTMIFILFCSTKKSFNSFEDFTTLTLYYLMPTFIFFLYY